MAPPRLGDVNELGMWMTAWTEWIHGGRAPRRRFASIEDGTRRLVAAWIVDGQIANGGMAQARATVPWMIDDAVAGLRSVGDVAGADALERGDDDGYASRGDSGVLDARLLDAAQERPGPPRR